MLAVNPALDQQLRSAVREVKVSLDRLLGVEHLASYLRTTPEVVEAMAASGELPSRMVDGRRIFSAPAVTAWLRNQSVDEVGDQAEPAQDRNSALDQRLERIEAALSSLVALLPQAPRWKASFGGNQVEFDVDAELTLEQLEKEYILWILNEEGFNKTATAARLGIDPSTLYRKLSKYGEPQDRTSDNS